ncbi:MAG: hypothetical protein U0165_02545 [Polyangiaceae bacterium]
MFRELPLKTHSSHARGLLYQLEQSLGTIDRKSAEAQLSALTRDDEKLLDRAKIVRGDRVVYAKTLLTPKALELRKMLTKTWLGARDVPMLPKAGAVSAPTPRQVDSAVYRALGFIVLGPRVVRADMVERLASLVREASSELDLHRVCSLLGCPFRDAHAVVSALSETRELTA